MSDLGWFPWPLVLSLHLCFSLYSPVFVSLSLSLSRKDTCERLRLVSLALGGTAGGTRMLSRSGGWRGVCKEENNHYFKNDLVFGLLSVVVF